MKKGYLGVVRRIGICMNTYKQQICSPTQIVCKRGNILSVYYLLTFEGLLFLLDYPVNLCIQKFDTCLPRTKSVDLLNKSLKDYV